MIFNTIDLWEGLEYIDESNSGYRPSLITYVMSKNQEIQGKKRPAILICPGGGYEYLSDREAEVIALNFNAAGFQAFVLKYSIFPNKYPKALLDAARAMCIIRENADEWEVDENKIIVCGFSAGGHLAANIGVAWNKDYVTSVEGITKGMTKPNGLILGYPVISTEDFGDKGSIDNLLAEDITVKSSDSKEKERLEELLERVSLEKQVSSETPQTFLWHTVEDDDVLVENSLVFAQALRKNGIKFEMHIYSDGCHGLSLATEETSWDRAPRNPEVSTWFNMAVTWVKNLNTIK